VKGNDHKQKYDTKSRKLCVPPGAAETKIYRVSKSLGRVSYRKNREIWNFGCFWNFAEHHPLALGGYRFSPRDASMQQSSYEWKLMKIDAIPRGTLQKSKIFVQNY